MNNKFHQLASLITYWLDAVDKHSLHSPFLFDFYSNVLHKTTVQDELPYIEEQRKKLLADRRIIEPSDFGSGSSSGKGGKRCISTIARTSLSASRFSGLYKRIIEHYSCKRIVELGTSLGINTLYLASAGESHVSTFEGSSQLADEAQAIFSVAEALNILIIRGNIDQTLPTYLEDTPEIDFIFIDANHRYSATLNYFNLLLTKAHEKTIIILDDIHYSIEMERAWQAIKINPAVFLTIDLFRCGILFLNPALTRQHVVLQF